MKKFLFILAASIFVALFSLPVFAETAGRVTATVTPKLISIQVSPSGFDYGTLNLGGSKTSNECTATNNGNVTENFEISGSTADSAGGSWQLVQADPAINQFRHSFALSTDYTSFTDLKLDRVTFDSSIVKDGVRNFKLKIVMPASLDNRPYTQYTTVVDLVATEH